MSRFSLSPVVYEEILRNALREDLGHGGDLTSDAIIPMEVATTAHVVARSTGRTAGVEIAARCFEIFDASLKVAPLVADGADVDAGEILISVHGRARSILGAERSALNILGRLCGIATLTRAYVRAVAGTGAQIVDTRKTTPGLRALEKYAVRCGGGQNHRFRLDDAVLIKDNHVAVAGGVTAAVDRVRAAVGHTVTVELEVDTLAQLEEGLDAGIDAVLLDNMDVGTLRQAVAMVAGRITTEASGGVNLETVANVAATGVDLISVGALTHSAPALDVSLEVGGEEF